MKLAVVLPSRGLVYSQTVEELYRELDALDSSFDVFWSHGRPIPECFNVPTEKALRGDYSHVLFVEEDMVLPRGIVKRLVAQKAHAVACDYPVSGGSGGTVMYDPVGVPLFTGCGLLLVETDLLRRMPKPIWRTDVRWKPYVEDGLIHFMVTVDSTKHYGQQDVAFGLRLYANGLPIKVIKQTIGQREMVKEGAKGDNEGFHVVRDRMEVVPRLDLTNIPKRSLFEEIIIDGKRVKVKKNHFGKLDNPEIPTYMKAGRAVFENHEILNGWLKLN